MWKEYIAAASHIFMNVCFHSKKIYFEDHQNVWEIQKNESMDFYSKHTSVCQNCWSDTGDAVGLLQCKGALTETWRNEVGKINYVYGMNISISQSWVLVLYVCH